MRSLSEMPINRQAAGSVTKLRCDLIEYLLDTGNAAELSSRVISFYRKGNSKASDRDISNCVCNTWKDIKVELLKCNDPRLRNPGWSTWMMKSLLPSLVGHEDKGKFVEVLNWPLHQLLAQQREPIWGHDVANTLWLGRDNQPAKQWLYRLSLPKGMKAAKKARMEEKLDERGAAPLKLTKAQALARHGAAEAEIWRCAEVAYISNPQAQRERLHRLHAALQHATGRRPCELQHGGPEFSLVEDRPFQLRAEYLRKQEPQPRIFPTLVEANTCLQAIQVLRNIVLRGYKSDGKRHRYNRGGASTHTRHTTALFQGSGSSNYSAIRGLYIIMAYETRHRTQFGLERSSDPTPMWYATQCLGHASKSAKEHYLTIIVVD